MYLIFLIFPHFVHNYRELMSVLWLFIVKRRSSSAELFWPSCLFDFFPQFWFINVYSSHIYLRRWIWNNPTISLWEKMVICRKGKRGRKREKKEGNYELTWHWTHINNMELLSWLTWVSFLFTLSNWSCDKLMTEFHPRI